MTIDFARRMANVRPSTIREILKVTEQPHVISFAGGLPAPELFPVEDVLTRHRARAARARARRPCSTARLRALRRCATRSPRRCDSAASAAPRTMCS